MNKYIIAVALGVALFALNVYNRNKYLQEKREKEIAESNVFNLMAENKTQTALVLTKEQIIGKTKAKVDSLSAVLKIRPKQITKIIERTITQTDTVIKEVTADIIGKNKWLLADSDKCFTWKGEAYLTDSFLSVKRTLFDYRNKTTQLFYWERKKILFLKIGKKHYFQKQTSDCGKEVTNEITFIK